MNTRKIAIFVEGQTEYIFVRDFLCAWYDNSPVKAFPYAWCGDEAGM